MTKSKDKPYGEQRGRDDDRAGWQGGREAQGQGRDRNEDDRIYGARGTGGAPDWDRPSQASGLGGAYHGGYGEGGLGEGGTGQRGGSGRGYGYGDRGGQSGYGPGGFTGAYGAGGPEHGRGGGLGEGGMGERGHDERGYGQGGYRQGGMGPGGFGQNFGQGYGQDAQRGQGWGGRDYGPGDRGYGYRSGSGAGERGFLERAGDEVSSWFGDEEARHRREADHRGKGPRGYRRSDDRIREDVNDRLSEDPSVDASDIEVMVENGEVTLTGEVSSRQEKRSAEDCVERISGVGHVQNNLRVRAGTGASSQPGQTGQTGRGSQL